MAERDAVSMAETPDMSEIQSVIGMARQAINREDPDLALERLREIKNAVAAHQSTPAWAEYPLVVAEAYAAENNQAAEQFFEDFFVRSHRAPELPRKVVLRAHMNYGGFLSRKKRWTRALKQYEQAEQEAVQCACPEQLAEIALRIIEARLQKEQDPEARKFLLFKKAAHNKHATSDRQLKAWNLYEKRGAEAIQSAIFRREGNGEEYFERLLDEVDEQVK